MLYAKLAPLLRSRVGRLLNDKLPISGNGFAFSGTGGVDNANFNLLGSTNLSTPATNWTRLLTKQFDNNGYFNFTNPLNPNLPQSFYRLQLI